MAEPHPKKHRLVKMATKKALAPVAHAAVTAGTAYLTRKALQAWKQQVQPKIEEKGGAGAVAKETLENVAEKTDGGAVGPKPSEKSSSGREAERRKRSQRRDQRRRALEKSSSS